MKSKDEVVLEFAQIVSVVNEAHIYLEDFVLKEKVSTGRDFRRQIRQTRDLCKQLLKTSLEWEKGTRSQRKGLKNV